MFTDPIAQIAAELGKYAVNVDRLANQLELGPELSESEAIRLSAPVAHLFGALVKLNDKLLDCHDRDALVLGE